MGTTPGKRIGFRVAVDDDLVGLDHVAGDVVAVFGDAGRVVDRACGDAGEVEFVQDLCQSSFSGPVRDGRVQFFLTQAAGFGGEQRFVGGEIVAADGPHEADEYGIGVAADDDFEVILAVVGTGGYHAGQAAASALADHAVRVVVRNEGFEQAEDALVEGDVHYLGPGLLDAPGLLQHQHQCADGAVESCDGVAHAGGRAAGRAVRFAGDVAQSGERFS